MQFPVLIALLSLAAAGHAADAATYSLLIDNWSDDQKAGYHIPQVVYRGLVIGANERDERITVMQEAGVPCVLGTTARIVLTQKTDGIVVEVAVTARQPGRLNDQVVVRESSLKTTVFSGPRPTLAEQLPNPGPVIIVVREQPAKAAEKPAERTGTME